MNSTVKSGIDGGDIDCAKAVSTVTKLDNAKAAMNRRVAPFLMLFP
jgi:hypothetical protein